MPRIGGSLRGFGILGMRAVRASVAVVVAHPKSSRELVDGPAKRDGRLLALITEREPILDCGLLDHFVGQQLDGTQVVEV